MKALFIDSPGLTSLRDVPEPVASEDEVVLRVRYVGYCGSDLSTFRGKNPLVAYPRIPGHEISGSIEARGANVPEEWSVGRNVTLSPYTECGVCFACRSGRPNCCRDNQTLGVQRDGALTERIAVPWRRLFASAKLGLRELAMVEPLTVGGHAVDRACVASDEVVVVLGCGAIGLGAVAGAAFRGARVVAVDIDDSKLALATRAGAMWTINTTRVELHAALSELTDGQGPAVVIEAIGLPETYRAAVEEVAFAGRVAYIGYAKAPVEFTTRLFVQKELNILGSRNAMPSDFCEVIAMLEDGRFPVDEAITRVVPLAEAGSALADWAAEPALVTKLLVDVAG